MPLPEANRAAKNRTVAGCDPILADVPCAEMVRFCKGGGEANAVAVRIARAATGRDKVLFCGYHGWHDWYLASGLGASGTLGEHLPKGLTPKGVPKALADSTINFEYNNLDSLRHALETNRGEIACIILEPARSFTPQPGFLEGIRQLATDHGAVLIFDEVVTGFRMARGGAQQYFGVTPDIATFAKCISNGFALGAVVGRSAVMEVALDSFISSVYWAEATGLVAGRATLREYLKLDVCRAVWSFGHEFVTGVRSLIQQTGVPVQVTGVEAFPTLIFDNALPHRDELTTLYMQETASRGLFGGPAHFFCSTHTELDLRCALIAIAEAFTLMRKALDDGDIVKFLKCPVRQSGFKRMV